MATDIGDLKEMDFDEFTTLCLGGLDFRERKCPIQHFIRTNILEFCINYDILLLDNRRIS